MKDLQSTPVASPPSAPATVPAQQGPDRPNGERVDGSPESGHGFIYVIYETARALGTSGAVVKSGMSEKPTNQRVLQQVNTGAPGTRRCGLIYLTEEVAWYERVLHGLLSAKVVMSSPREQVEQESGFGPRRTKWSVS